MTPHDPLEPTFSIVIPTCSRPLQLSACLASMARLNYPDDKLEVIVVNDGGSDLPESLIQQTRKNIPISLHSQEKSGPATARNVGARHAMGEYLAFTDDDCAPDSEWLRCLASRFASAPRSMVGGMTINGLEQNPFATVSQIIVSYLCAETIQRPEPMRFFASNNFAVLKNLFDKTGGFDETFPLAASEDRDFCYRWWQNGYRMYYAPEVVVFHFHALHSLTFFRQHFNYGRGAFQFFRKHFNSQKRTFPVKPLPFYLNLLRYLFSRSKNRMAPFLIPLLAVSQLATFAGYMQQHYQFTVHGSQTLKR